MSKFDFPSHRQLYGRHRHVYGHRQLYGRFFGRAKNHKVDGDLENQKITWKKCFLFSFIYAVIQLSENFNDSTSSIP